jgi:hypothetical protein
VKIDGPPVIGVAHAHLVHIAQDRGRENSLNAVEDRMGKRLASVTNRDSCFGRPRIPA